MNPSISVRAAELTDLDSLIDFNLAMARESEGRALDREALRAGVTALLQDPTRGFYQLAEVDGEVRGQLMVTPEWSDWSGRWFWWIQSVYVHPAARRRGVFEALYEAVRARARARGDVRELRLYVEQRNAGAQRCYQAVGMTRSHYQMYESDL
jgi:ribosomal protein S18 acetylase RimI-like enzyme